MEHIPETKTGDVKEQKNILEIGVGNFPIYKMSDQVKEDMGAGASYVALDNLPEGLNGIEGDSVIADIASLPFGDSSIDEMWLMNVFSGLDINIYSNDKDTNFRDAIRGSAHSPEESNRVQDILHELSRVLDQEGEIHIGEIYARIGNDLSWMKDISYHDFGLDSKVYEGPDIKEFLEQHDFKNSMAEYLKFKPEEHPFFVTLTKLKEK